MEILLSLGVAISLFAVFLAVMVMLDIIMGADKIKSDLSEFKKVGEKQLSPCSNMPRTGRLTGGLTPGKGMTYVPSDELIDAIR